MYCDVVEARYVAGYVVWLRFADGTAGEIDIWPVIARDGEVFRPLKDLAFFKQFFVDAETGTIAWPNDADLAPDVLYDQIRIAT
jgi:Protein of unknown function (DUF2442)